MRETTEQQMADSLRSLKQVCEATVAEVKSQHAQTKEELIRSRLAILKVSGPAGCLCFGRSLTCLSQDAAGASSLKRKRDFEEHDPTNVAPTDMSVDPPPLSASTSTASAQPHQEEGDDTPMLAVPDFGPALDDSEEESTRPTKRQRRGMKKVASVVAQTAGAVTVGAVAAWSVLAFS